MVGATFSTDLPQPGFEERGLRGLCALMATLCCLLAILLAGATLVAGFELASIRMGSPLASSKLSWNWGGVIAGRTSITSSPVYKSSSGSSAAYGSTTSATCRPPTKVVCGRNSDASFACRIEGDPTRCQVVQKLAPPGQLAKPLSQGIIDWVNVGVMLTPFVALVVGLAEASACFVCMARRRFLGRGTVRHLRNFAVCGLAFVFLSPHLRALAYGLDYLVDMAANALGPKNVTVYDRFADFTLATSGVSDVLTVIFALTLVVIASVMARAAAIAEDHAQIV
jgi:hypothetical protein